MLRDEFTHELQNTKSSGGFVPDQVLEECSVLETLVFATVHYLSYNSIKPSRKNVVKKTNLSNKVVKDMLCSLCKRRFIVKQDDGTYLFKNFNYPLAELVDAKGLVSPFVAFWWI